MHEPVTPPGAKNFTRFYWPRCRYDVALAIWLFGAAVQLVFAAQHQLQKDFLQHERMKAYQYLVSLCVVMVASILLNEAAARACLATALHGYILHGGSCGLPLTSCMQKFHWH
jgi:hypothetical protein